MLTEWQIIEIKAVQLLTHIYEARTHRPKRTNSMVVNFATVVMRM